MNLIEWGDGIFGAEAASRRYFMPASELNPGRRHCWASRRPGGAAAPDRRTGEVARMVRRGWISQDQYLVALGREPEHHGFFDWLFGPSTESAPAPAAPPAPVEESAPAESVSQQPAPADSTP